MADFDAGRLLMALDLVEAAGLGEEAAELRRLVAAAEAVDGALHLGAFLAALGFESADQIRRLDITPAGWADLLGRADSRLADASRAFRGWVRVSNRALSREEIRADYERSRAAPGDLRKGFE